MQFLRIRRWLRARIAGASGNVNHGILANPLHNDHSYFACVERWAINMPQRQMPKPCKEDNPMRTVTSAAAVTAVLVAAHGAAAGTPSLTLTHLASTPRAGYDVAAAEIVAFDPATRRAFVVNGFTSAIDVFDLTDPAAPAAAGSFSLLPYGGGVQSVAVRNGRIACAVSGTIKTDPGLVVFVDTNLNFVAAVAVGALPDMVTFTPDGTKVITANEGEPSDDYQVDPEGSISIIDVSGPSITQSSVTTLGFNGLAPGIIDPRIVPFGPGNPTIGQDLEPEYVAVSPDSSTAFVTIQEHSAIATVDLVNGAILSVKPLGTKRHYEGRPTVSTSVVQGLPPIGTTAGGQEILLGGFSGLWIDSVDPVSGVMNLWTNTDRGPNLEPVNVDGDPALERPFALPGFQPRIVTLAYDPSTGTVGLTGEILLRKPDGSPLTGLPNIQGNGPGLAYTDEQPCDLFGAPIANDPLGADLEGLCRTSDGTIWMCDEYRPALYKFDSTGLMLDRFVPAGSNGFGASVGTEAFPAVYAQRRDNRGFEAIAVWDDKLYCFVQSPLDNPDVANDANSKSSRNIRIAKFDPVTSSVVAEYLYTLEGGASDKIGDACAYGPGRFLVVERDSATGSTSKKMIFEISLQGATDISSLPGSVAGPGGTLDRMTPAQLAAAGIVPVTKRPHVDLAAIGYADSIEKVEGLAIRDPSTILVINDNDFRMPLTWNIATGTFTPNGSAAAPTLGVITFSGYGLDASDQDGANRIVAWPVEGAYQPDGIAAFSHGGQTYLIAANEGDSREWGGFVDLTTVGNASVTLDPHVFRGASWLKRNTQLGRLQVRKDLGDLDGDGDWDRIVPIGARGITVWSAAGDRVWDSGDAFEQHIAQNLPAAFNVSHTNNTRDNRSRAKGPEPEGVVVGTIGSSRYFFAICERVGGVFAFCAEDPANPVFAAYANTRDFTFATGDPASRDLGPEGITFVPAQDSPSGRALLLVAHEISGTLAIFEATTSCANPGDIDGDCVVNGNDLSEVLARWGSCAAPCAADLNGDGQVNGRDLAMVLAAWGS